MVTRNSFTALTVLSVLSMRMLHADLVNASTYGGGDYGDGHYGVGTASPSPTPTPVAPTSPSPSSTTSSTESGSSSGGSESTTCQDQTPGTNPAWLYGGIPEDGNSVMLYFTAAESPVNKYVLQYGIKSGNYQYGVADLQISNQGQMTYRVGGLAAYTEYFFRIRSDNGCATGPWSNEISSRTKQIATFKNLSFSDSLITPELVEKKSDKTCQEYIVKSGDTLSKIANTFLGDWARYKEIVDQNLKEYPSLASSNRLSVGWELKISCSQTKVEEDSSNLLLVNIKVIDSNKKPIKGANVTLYSDPREATTGEDGIARFDRVEEGQHRVVVNYGNYQGEQTIFLTATEATHEFDINITVTPQDFAISKFLVVAVAVLLLVIIFLILRIIKQRKTK